ncbi:DNA-helicase Pif1-like [Sesbania bispinosa]|nr:DNA-helicase Pif1-like [Sesbania bispinosa]
MRLQCLAPDQSREELREFADWILAIGEGTAGVDNDGIGIVNISTDMVLNGDCDPIQEIVDYTYLNLLHGCWSPVFFTDKVVLATTLDAVETINSYALSLFHGEEKVRTLPDLFF